MNGSKKIISLILVGMMMVISLCACGGASTSNNETTEGTKTAAETTTGVSDEVTAQNISAKEIKLPDTELKNKKIVIYQFDEGLWRSEDPKHPSYIDIMEKEYGAEFGVVAFKDWGKQMEKLLALYMSNDMPDLLDNMAIPVPVGNGLLAPCEKYVDFTNPMWDDVRSLLEANKWNGKYYVCPLWKLENPDWCYFNPQFFEANNMKSPVEYYNEGTWDWNALLDIAKQTTLDTDGDGKIDQWGVGNGSTFDFHTQTGVPIVDITPEGEIKLNLRDPKIEAAANFYRQLGPAGYNVLKRADDMENAKAIVAGKMAVGVLGWWVGVQEGVKDGWAKGTLDFVPLPRYPGETTNYLFAQMQGYGIGNKAKNPEGAALAMQVLKFTGTDAYRMKYCPEDVVTIGNSEVKACGASEETLKRIIDMNESYKTMPVVPIRFAAFWGWDIGDGFKSVLEKPWSQILEEIEPIAQKSVAEWKEKMKDY